MLTHFNTPLERGLTAASIEPATKRTQPTIQQIATEALCGIMTRILSATAFR